MAVTIYDVARTAKVGIATVSRALNNSPNISEDTKQRILKAVKQLNYRPHSLARGLASRKTYTISVIVPFFTSPFYVSVLAGIQKEAINHNYDLILYSVEKVKKLSFYLERAVSDRKVDGIVVLSLGVSDFWAKKMYDSKFPCVLVDSFHPLLDSISVNNEHGAYSATEYLIKSGHKKVACITGNFKSIPAMHRYSGYKKALEDNNLEINHKMVVECKFVNEKDGFTEEAGYIAMNRFLEQSAKPSAAFISSDIQAIGAMKAITDKGLKVPDDISIIGFDDIELSQYLGLTTVKQPMYEMGKLAVEILFEKEKKEEDIIFSKVFDTQLIIRSSCRQI